MTNELNVINNNGKLYLDSRDVAKMVGKRHDHLLRDIKGYIDILEDSPNLGSGNFFVSSEYINSQKRKMRCYLLTRKGCDMVANKLTGKKGVLFTATYVTKFEEMENTLKQEFKLPTSYKEALLQLVEQVEENERLQTEKLMLEQQVFEYEPKVTYYDTILKSKDVINISQIAKDYGLTGIKLNQILNEEGVQYKMGGQWLLYKKYADKGYTKSHTQEYNKPNGEKGCKLHTKWTQKGRLFIHQLLDKKGIKALIDIEEDIA